MGMNLWACCGNLTSDGVLDGTMLGHRELREGNSCRLAVKGAVKGR